MSRTSTAPGCCSSRRYPGSSGPGSPTGRRWPRSTTANWRGPTGSRAPGWNGSGEGWPPGTHGSSTRTHSLQPWPRSGEEFVDGVLARPYDGSMLADRAASGFTSRWIDQLISSVRPVPEPAVRSGYVGLSSAGWHQVSVLKFVNQYFILERPDLAMLQRGQEQTIEQLVVAFDSWLGDRGDAVRAPRRLVDLVLAATRGYERIACRASRVAGRPYQRRRPGSDGPGPRNSGLRQRPDRRAGRRLRRPARRCQRAALEHRRSVRGIECQARCRRWSTTAPGLPAPGAAHPAARAG